MRTLDHRQSAREHCEKARALLATEARYACLELRMAVEALTYSSLRTYISEVSNSAMQEWTPKRVLDELLAVNPTVDQSRTIAVRRQSENGVPSHEARLLGEDRRFSVKWANRAHNALSSFLHEPTLAQLEKGIGDVDAAARKKAEEVLSELDAVLASRIWNVDFSESYTFKCECGFTVKRRLEVIESGELIACASCGLRYDAELFEGGAKFRLREVPYTCSGCGDGRAINERDLERLPVVNCGACGFRSQVVQAYELHPLGPADPG